MKNPNHKRESQFPFAQRFLTGLIIALALSLTAFEWTTTKAIPSLPPLEVDSAYVHDGEILPPIELEQKQIEQLKPNPPSNEMTVVEELTPDVIDEPVEKPIENTPTTETATIIDYGPDINYTETEIDKIHTVVEIFAHYDKCKELRGEELKMCSELSIVNEVKRVFRVTEQMKAIGGRQVVLMSFVIDKEGGITEIETVKTQNKYVARAAKEAIEKLPSMNPAIQQGRKVALRVQIPITVRID